MIDIMFDAETMGTGARAPMVSFGAIQFDPCTGKTGQAIYRVIDLHSVLAYKEFEVEAGTVYWWLQQSDAARLALLSDDNRESIGQALNSLNQFFEGCGTPGKLRLWGNGPSFDNAILRNHYKTVTNADCPIPFWNDRCVRTIKGLIPFNMVRQWQLDNQRKGVYHNALDDAKYQVKMVSHILSTLGATEVY